MLEELREKLRKTQQDKEVEGKKGSQPKKYYAKDADGDEMSKSTKDKRAAHFQKNKDKEGEDAFKPAPGDSQAEFGLAAAAASAGGNGRGAGLPLLAPSEAYDHPP